MSTAPQSTPKTMIARQIARTDTGARGFLVWLKAAMPGAYNAIKGDVARFEAKQKAHGAGKAFGDVRSLRDGKLGSLGILPGDVPAGTAPASSGWSDLVSKALTVYAQYKLTDQQLDAAKQIWNVNLQRAQEGLAPLPIDPTEYGVGQPTARIGLTGDTQKMFLWGAGILAAVILLPKLLRGAR